MNMKKNKDSSFCSDKPSWKLGGFPPNNLRKQKVDNIKKGETVPPSFLQLSG